MMFRTLVLIALLFIAASIPSGQAQAGTVLFEFDLSTPTVTATEATFDISLLFEGNAGDQIKGYGLSVHGSSPLLTDGIDFSRFGYIAANSPSPLDSWFSLGLIGLTGLEPGIPFDPAGPFIEPSHTPLVLGTLFVDLTGIPAGTELNVTLADVLTDFPTDLGGTFGRQEVDSVVDYPNTKPKPDLGLKLTFSDPKGVTFQTIPEPSSVMIWGCFGLVLLARRRLTLAFKRCPAQ